VLACCFLYTTGVQTCGLSVKFQQLTHITRVKCWFCDIKIVRIEVFSRVILLGKTASAKAQHRVLQDCSPQHQCCELLKSHIRTALFAQDARNRGLTLCILSINFIVYLCFIYFFLFFSGNREDCLRWNIASCPDNYL
jgi:hypothetical protein